MSGRDLIGIAKTGSGKTLAFLLPMFRHVIDQPALEEDDGPIGELLYMSILMSSRFFTWSLWGVYSFEYHIVVAEIITKTSKTRTSVALCMPLYILVCEMLFSSLCDVRSVTTAD